MAEVSITTLLGILGSVASIVAVFLPASGWRARIVHVVYGLAIVALAVWATSYARELGRIRSVERAAARLVSTRRMDYTDVGYVQAALAFLEANKKLYPDTYARAQKLCDRYDCYGSGRAPGQDTLGHSYGLIDLASAMDGILRGISAVESGRPLREG